MAARERYEEVSEAPVAVPLVDDAAGAGRLYCEKMEPSARPAPPEIEVGTVLDRYEIVRHVARGGMGSVWLARFAGKHGFTKDVAVKTIVPELAENPQFHGMFLEEARISSKLVHANAAQVLDVGEHGRTVYIVFEWVDGRSLEELCRSAETKGTRVALGLVLRALADACAGLHAAHTLTGDDDKPLGIVHRDVTPNNILVSHKGFAKVIDFGIAKARDRVAGETRSGFVKGTPQYMSPEAACKLTVDRRADVWSLGAVLYRALAGKPAFGDHVALLDYIDGAAKLPALPDDVPADVKAIAKRALAVAPGDRFQTAEEMRSALERAMHASGAALSPPEANGAAVVGPATTVKPAGAEASGPAEDEALGYDSTKLAIPSLSAPRVRAPDARAPGGTLVSPTHRSPPKDPKPALAGEGSSTRVLVAALAVASVVTAAAAVLAFCG